MEKEKPTKKNLEDRVRDLEAKLAEAERANAAMAGAEERLRLVESIIEQVGDGISVAAMNRKILFTNKRYAESHQYSPEELQGQDIRAFHTEKQYIEEVEPFIARTIEKGFHSGVVNHVKKDGTEFPVFMNVTVLKDFAGNNAGLAGMMIDLIGRKWSEGQLRNMELQKLDLIDSIMEHVIYLDTELRVIWANSVSSDSLGKKPEEMAGMKCHDLWYENDYPCVGCPIKKAIESGVPQQEELATPDGKSWFIRGYPVRNDNGVVTGVVEFALEITERKNAEKALRKSERQYRETIDAMRDIIHVIDSEMRIALYNGATAQTCESLGTTGDLTGRYLWEVFPFLPSVVFEEYRRVFDSGEAAESEECTVIGGIETITETRKIPIIENGRTAQVVTIVHDITSRKTAEEALRESEERYRSLAESAHDAIFIVNRDLRVEYTNEFAGRMLGRAAEETFGVPLSRLFPPENYASMKQSLERVFETGEPLFIEKKYRFGQTEMWLDTQLVPLGDSGDSGDVRAVLGVSRDINERKRAEEQLRDAKERLEATISALPDMFFEMDVDGRFLDFHAPNPELLYAPPESFLGKSIPEVLPPAAAEILMDANRKVMESGRNVSVEYHLNMQDGGEEFFEATLAPKGSPDSPQRSIVALVRNITERKKLEQAKINFLSSVSHELRTPLSLIMGYAQLLLRENLPHNVKKKINIILDRGRQELKLIEELITLAQFESGETRYEMSDVQLWPMLEKYLGEARIMVASLVEKRYRTSQFRFDKQVDPALKGAIIRCDQRRISQVLDNLFENAVKYSDKDRLEFEFTASAVDGRVEFCVRDSGVGIPTEEQENIFKPFYQLRKGRHPLSDGIGKGLSIVREFVEAHGGSLRLESEPGSGSAFFFSLPVTGFAEYVESRTVGSVLLVDDDRDFVEYVETLLVTEGFEVRVAFGEKDALASLAEHRPDLILLDIQLPDGNGMDICYKLKKTDEFSSMYIYLMSAKLPGELSIIAKEAKADGYFSKPFEIDAFLDTIERLKK